MVWSKHIKRVCTWSCSLPGQSADNEEGSAPGSAMAAAVRASSTGGQAARSGGASAASTCTNDTSSGEEKQRTSHTRKGQPGKLMPAMLVPLKSSPSSVCIKKKSAPEARLHGTGAACAPLRPRGRWLSPPRLSAAPPTAPAAACSNRPNCQVRCSGVLKGFDGKEGYTHWQKAPLHGSVGVADDLAAGLVICAVGVHRAVCVRLQAQQPHLGSIKEISSPSNSRLISHEVARRRPLVSRQAPLSSPNVHPHQADSLQRSCSMLRTHERERT